jgi:tetratricopeptide (TPR) repeat protein
MPRHWTILVVGLAICLRPSLLHSDTTRAWEGTIDLPTYLLGAPDPNPPFPLINRHDVYPYAMLDDLTDQREVKSYRAFFLENEYLKATILPDLGGRLYSLYDKVDKREVFYRNHVVKYGLVGLRGAWISGGVEFNFPNGHTTLTVSPVEARLFHNADGSATVVVGAMDWVTGMHWEVALTLRPGQARLEQHVTLLNSTPLPDLYWYWANAAVPATEDMQFIYPMREANPHAVGEAWTYPVSHGIDYSWYKNIRQPTSLFGLEVHRNFFGAYYHVSDFGVVHVADYHRVPGKKIWSWGVAGDGLIWTNLLTDVDGPYNEIQSGRYETQLTREFMSPHRIESWTEYWYPVRGLGSAFVEATKSLAIAVNHPARSGDTTEIALLPTIDLPGARIVVKVGQQTATELGPVDFHALAVRKFAVDRTRGNSQDPSNTLTVDIEDQQGRAILHWSAADPIDGNPEFVSAAGRHEASESPQKQPSVEALFLDGVDREKRGDEEEALRSYRQVLDRDPGYIPALIKLAWNSYRGADFAAAESYVGRGLARSSVDPQLQYAAGVIYRVEGRWTLAGDAFWRSIRFGGAMAPALAQLGEIAIRQKQYGEAARWLQEALDHEPGDVLVRVDLAVALRLAGDRDGARQAVDAALAAMPLFPFALAESWRAGEPGDRNAVPGETAASTWGNSIPPDAEYDLAVAAWYLRLGDLDSAGLILAAARDRLPSGAQSPLLDYYLGYIARQRGQTGQAEKLRALGAREPDVDVFPDRLEDEVVLADAASHHPEDTRVASLQGTFLFAHGRYDEAARLWRHAIDEGLKDAVVERNLGVFDWRVKGDLQAAAGDYETAIRLAPDQYRLYPDLDEIYSESGDFARRSRLFAGAPAAVLDHDVVRVRRTLLLVEQGQFDQALATLTRHRFKPWEGGEIVREMFVVANLEKGRSAIGEGNPREAEQDFRNALTYPENLGVGKPDHPADAQALYWLGEALAAQDKTDAARASWHLAAEESAGSRATTSLYRAAALLQLGEDDEGWRLMDDVIARAASKDAGAAELFAAGLAHDLTGDQAQARLDFQHTLEIDPSYWQARVGVDRLAGHRTP